MKLNSESCLVKLAYLPEKFVVPAESSVCAVFWRTVAIPFWLIGGLYILALGILTWPASFKKGREAPRLLKVIWWSVVAGVMLSMIAALAITDPRQFLITLGTCFLVLVLFGGGLFLWDYLDSRGTFDREPLAVAYLKAKKQRFCPKVEFV